MTSILISNETWQIINAHKQCGETMESSMLRLMGLKKPSKEEPKDAPPATN
jgi:hypothetical protein